MSRIIETIPTREVLRDTLRSILKTKLPDFIKTTHSRRAEVVGNRRWFAIAFSFTVAVVMALYSTRDTYGTLSTNILFGCLLIWLSVIYLSGSRWLTNSRLLDQEMSMALMPILGIVLNRTMLYTQMESFTDETRKQLINSGLFNMDDVKLVAENRFTIYDEKQEISIREVHMSTPLPESFKLLREADLFSGVLVVTQLPSTYSGKTFITTTGKMTDTAQEQFMSELVKDASYTELIPASAEWSQAVKIVSTDEATGREILETHLVEELYKWWQLDAHHMRVAIIKDMLYILIPKVSIVISNSTTSTKLPAIERYAWNVVRPVWHSFLLVDAVKRR